MNAKQRRLFCPYCDNLRIYDSVAHLKTHKYLVHADSRMRIVDPSKWKLVDYDVVRVIDNNNQEGVQQ